MKILNATSLKPVSATYTGDDSINIKGDNVRIETNDGYPYIRSSVMNSLVDVKCNKHSFFGMTSAMNSIDLVEDTNKTIETIGPVAISHDNTLNGILGVDEQYNLIRVSLTDDQAVLFALEHYETDGSNEYYIMKYRDTAITIDPDNSNEIIYSDFGANDDQLFRIIPVNSDTISFYSKDGRYAKLYNNQFFHFKTSQGETINPNDLSSEFNGYDTTNKWVRYENFYAPEYSTTPSILSVDDVNSLSGIKTNFVLNAPYESITIDGNSATMPIDIIPTKNFKTINSELSLIPTSGVSGSDLVDFREYRRIYTGGNQIEGYANINLGYSSDYSSVITFEGDAFTYFHFPITAPEISIQSAGLEFAGAFAGAIPEFSDRIYKKLANYEDMVWWGGGEHYGVQDGTWLCAWLSGGDDSSVWIERYYDPGEISFENALTAESGGTVDNIEFTPNNEPVQDIVSTMTLEPGAYYRYYHVGNGGFEKILDSLKGATDDNLVIQLSDFTLGNIVNDESSNSNDGVISNYDNADEVTLDIGFGSESQSAILLNGNSEIQINSSTTLNVEGDKSISSWIYSRDWNNGRSATLFTNYYKGGDKFEYMNHGLYYSYMVPNAEFGAERFTVIPSELSGSDQLIDYNDIDGVPVSVAIDLDGFQWIATYVSPTVINPDGQTLLFKLTSSGKVLESVSINPTDFNEEVAQLIIKDNNFGYLVDVTGKAYEFDIHDIKFTGNTTSIGNEYAYININGDFDSVGGNVLDLDQFDDGTLCTIQDDGSNGIRLHVGSTIQPTFRYQTFNHVVCDDNKYYFATTYDTSNTLRLYKFNKDDDSIVEQSAMIGASNSINAPFVTKEAINGVVSTVIYWIGGNQINKYYINSEGEMELVLTFTTENFIGTVNGDFSGYKLNKIHHKLNNSKPYLKYSALVGIPPDARKVVLTLPADELSDNWHYFTIVKDPTEETIKLYIDGELDIDSVVSGVPEDILYLTGSMLNIGGASDGSDPLFELLGLKDRDINGGVSEFSIFSTVLSDTDVRSLYISKFTGNDKMEWVINNGKKDFVEEFQNMFKFKKPGIKSQFFNVIVKNLDLTDDEKAVYEAFIRTEIVGLLPANIKLVGVTFR